MQRYSISEALFDSDGVARVKMEKDDNGKYVEAELAEEMLERLKHVYHYLNIPHSERNKGKSDWKMLEVIRECLQKVLERPEYLNDTIHQQ